VNYLQPNIAETTLKQHTADLSICGETNRAVIANTSHCTIRLYSGLFSEYAPRVTSEIYADVSTVTLDIYPGNNLFRTGKNVFSDLRHFSRVFFQCVTC
jgi:hypothetical protein